MEQVPTQDVLITSCSSADMWTDTWLQAEQANGTQVTLIRAGTDRMCEARPKLQNKSPTMLLLITEGNQTVTQKRHWALGNQGKGPF